MSDKPKDELELLTAGPPNADWTLILAHGAGQDMRSSFMAHIAGALGQWHSHVFAKSYFSPRRLTA